MPASERASGSVLSSRPSCLPIGSALRESTERRPTAPKTCSEVPSTGVPYVPAFIAGGWRSSAAELGRYMSCDIERAVVAASVRDELEPRARRRKESGCVIRSRSSTITKRLASSFW